LAERQPGKGEEPITGFLEAVGHRLAFEPPFADKSPSALLDFRRRGRLGIEWLKQRVGIVEVGRCEAFGDPAVY
jgi:hypothetical protein